MNIADIKHLISEKTAQFLARGTHPHPLLIDGQWTQAKSSQTIDIINPAMPFGGCKQSGIGRDLGKASLGSYRETKSVFIAV